MPGETKKDFCCLIISGFGAGVQAGTILRDHLQGSGIDAFLTTPSGKETLRVEQEHWVHGIRMEYLSLRKKYRRIALVGLSLGGMMLVHLVDLNPAAVVFVNTPGFGKHRSKELHRIFDADLKAQMHGVLREPRGRHELRRFAEATQKRGVYGIHCPALILQTCDDCVSDPKGAEQLYKLLCMPDKAIRNYREGGHDVLTSRTVMAVCSDIFQFCSRIRGAEA